MRNLNQYRLSEWFKARPLVHLLRRARYVARDRLFRSTRPQGLERFLEGHAHLASGTVAITIAFNTPWVIDLLTRSAKRHLGADALIVLDNSRQLEARAEIERLCRCRSVSYFPLPHNPERNNICRSHGIAMNWAYYNVIRPLRPRVFAFLDHDLFLLERLDLAAQVAAQPFYGQLYVSPWGWHLWAGYCLFDYAAVEPHPLDFNKDDPHLLDTGGRNYHALYRHFDYRGMRFAQVRTEQLLDPADGCRRPVQVIDGAVHVSGAAHRPKSSREHVGGFYQRLVQACEAGTSLDDFRPSLREKQVG